MSTRFFETRIDVARPQELSAGRRFGVRSLLYKVHLWLGALSVVYLLLIGVSGCAILFGQELHEFFSPAPHFAVGAGAARLDPSELKRIAEVHYPQAAIVALFDKALPSGTAAEVWIEQDHVFQRRLFDPYAGTDLGDAHPWTLRLLAWLRELHTELLGGDVGRIFNSLGAFALIVLSVSGAMMGWKRLRPRRRSENEHIRKNRRFAALTTRPNPDLEMETARNFSVTLTRKWSRTLSSQLTAFYNQLYDRITYVRDGSGTGQYRNFGEVTYGGGDAAFTWRPSDKITVKGNYAYLAATDRRTDNDLTGKPRHAGTVSIQYRPMSALALQLSGEFEDESYEDTANTSVFPGYELVDFKAEYNWPAGRPSSR